LSKLSFYGELLIRGSGRGLRFRGFMGCQEIIIKG